MSVRSIAAPRWQPHALDAKLVVSVLFAAAAMAGVSGLTASAIFRQPSTEKWALAFVGPILLLVLVNSAEPLVLLYGAALVVIPFGDTGALLLGVHIPAAFVVVGAAVVTAILSGPDPRRLTSLGAAGLAGAVLLLIPMFEGAAVFAHAVILCTAASIGWLTSVMVRKLNGVRIVMTCFVLSASVQALFAIYELTTKHQINFYGSAGSAVFGPNYFFGYESTFRPVGSFYDPISLGNMLGIALPLGLVLAVQAATTVKRLAAFGMIGVIGAGLLLTLSRMSWVAAAAGLLLTILLLPGKQSRRALGTLLPLVGIIAALAFGGGSTAFGDRVTSILHPRSAKVVTASGDIARVQDWAASVKIWAKHAVAGAGLGHYPLALSQQQPDYASGVEAQSTYLQLLAEGGLLGAGALLILVLTQVRGLFDLLRAPQRVFAAALAGATLAMLIEWSTDVTVRYAPVAGCMAVVFGATAGLLQTRRAESRDTTRFALSAAGTPVA